MIWVKTQFTAQIKINFQIVLIMHKNWEYFKTWWIKINFTKFCGYLVHYRQNSDKTTTKSLIVNSFINSIHLGKDIRSEWISIMVLCTLCKLCTLVSTLVSVVSQNMPFGESDKCKSFHQLIESIVSCWSLKWIEFSFLPKICVHTNGNLFHLICANICTINTLLVDQNIDL